MATKLAIKLLPPRRPTTIQASVNGAEGAFVRFVCRWNRAWSALSSGKAKRTLRNVAHAAHDDPANQLANNFRFAMASIIVNRAHPPSDGQFVTNNCHVDPSYCCSRWPRRLFIVGVPRVVLLALLVGQRDVFAEGERRL